jgi:hypothetical protein
MTANENEIALAISRILDQLRENAGEPVWLPLELTVPADWCDGYMWMGATKARTPKGEQVTVFCYKHGITRHYLNIGDDLELYRYRADLCEIGDPVYEQSRPPYCPSQDLQGPRGPGRYPKDQV